MKRIAAILIGITLLLSGYTNTYYFPAEDEKHEGTWLNWPHEYTYGRKYRKEIESIWVEMTYALHKAEKVHIVAYNKEEKARITSLLRKNQVDLKQVDFVIAKSDDVWARDTGPMFVYDSKGQLTIADFAFDGWGKKVPYKKDDKIPQAVAKAKGIPIVSIPDFVLEGGSAELDGAGTVMACKSSVISKNRNPGMSQKEAESYLRKYFGVTNFIWLEGVINQDITDSHIDGTARFIDDQTILTVPKQDFFELYENMPKADYKKLMNAKNAKGQQYEIVEIPLTDKIVKGTDYQGSYLNYYIGNEVLLLPIYNDVNDAAAIDIFEELYPDKEIVPIDVTAMFKYGGVIHCITQQQPADFE